MPYVYDHTTAANMRAASSANSSRRTGTDSIIQLLLALSSNHITLFTATEALAMVQWPAWYTERDVNAALATNAAAFTVKGFVGITRQWQVLIAEPHQAFTKAIMKVYCYLLVNPGTEFTIVCAALHMTTKKMQALLLAHPNVVARDNDLLTIDPSCTTAPITRRGARK